MEGDTAFEEPPVEPEAPPSPTGRELLEETVAKAQSTAQEARLEVREAAAEAASAAPSPTKAEMDQAQQMTDMEAKVKQEVAELDRLIAAEEYKLSVLSGERPATPEYSRMGDAAATMRSVMAPPTSPKQPGLAATFKTAAEFETEMDVELLKRSVAECAMASDAAVKQAAEVQEAVDFTEAALVKLNEEAEGMAARLAHWEERPPGDHGDYHRLRLLFEETQQRRFEQEELLTKLHGDLEYAQRAEYAAGLEMAHSEELMKEVGAMTGVMQDKQLTIAQQRQAAEDRAIRTFERKRRATAAEQAAKADNEAAKAAAVISAAHEGQIKAVRRLREYQTSIKAKMEAMEKEYMNTVEQRAHALVNLKQNIDAARDLCVGQHARKVKRERIQARKQAIEFKQMVDRGENPYIAFRKREEDARREGIRQVLAADIKQRNLELAQKIVKEDQLYDKEMAAKREAEAFERDYQRSIGRDVAEAKVASYILKKTRKNVEVLDPTGNAPWFPSQEALEKDWKFGTGKAEPAAVEMLQKKYQQLPNPLLLSRDHYSDFKRRGPIREQNIPMPSLGAYAEDDDAPPPTAAAAAAMAVSAGMRADEPDDDDVTGEQETPPTMPAEEDAASSESKRLQVRELTVFEKNMMAEALERQKANVVKKQVVWGREFQGQAFLSKPKVLLFKDFVVGKVYTKKLTLTNVSYTFSTFKVLSVEDEYKDFFDISYNFPGAMSAGMSCTLTVKFDPRLNQDIDTTIPCLGETGPFAIPLKARIKRRIISLLPNSGVYFGMVTVAESRTATLTLVNDGALRADFTIDITNTPADGSGEEPTSGPFSHPTAGRVDGYTRTDLEFGFHPMAEGVASLDLIIKFATDDVPPIFVRLEGMGGIVPIAVDKDLVDLRTCVLGRTYRDKIVIHNRGKTALKCSMKLKSSLMDYLLFNPELLYCQGGASSYFNVTFKPTAAIWEDLGRLVDRETGVMEVPLRVAVPDQVLPVHLTLRATLTTRDLVFDPPSLSFGTVALGETVLNALKVTNSSKLTQKFGFVNLPQEVEVRPQKGFGTLLPGESTDVTVRWTPRYTGEQEDVVCCRTLLVNHTYPIPFVGKCFKSPLSFNQNLLLLPATAWHNTTTASVEVTNASKLAQTFEFAAPLGSHVTISPLVTTLPPGGVQRVQFDFTPKLPAPPPPAPPLVEADDAAVADVADAQPSSGGKGGTKAAPPPVSPREGETAPEAPAEAPAARDSDAEWEDDEEWEGDPLDLCERTTVRVPCYIRGTEHVMYVELQTIVVETKVALQPIANPTKELPLRPRVPECGMYNIKYDKVPVGKKVVRNIVLCNITENELAEVSLAPFDHTQVFCVINSRAPVPPNGGKLTLMVQFAPSGEGRFERRMTLRTSLGPLVVRLSGEGVAPKMVLENNLTALDMKDAFMNEMVEHTIEMTNTSPFELPFTCHLQQLNHRTLGGVRPFAVHPTEGVVAPGKKQKLTVTFRADHEPVFGITHMFTEDLRIVVPNQKEDLLVKLIARCWERGMYMVGGDEGPRLSDSFMASESAAFVQRRSKTAESDDNHVSMTVTLPNEVSCGSEAVKRIPVGNLPVGGAGGAGDFAITPISPAAAAAGWVIQTEAKSASMGVRALVVNLRIDEWSGLVIHSTMPPLDSVGESPPPWVLCGVFGPQVPTGERKDLLIEFHPPEVPLPAALAHYGLGEWYTVTTTVTLKGGGNASGGGKAGAGGGTGLAGNTVVSLTARCFLKGITE